MVIDLTGSDDYSVIDVYEENGWPYYKVACEDRAFWCRYVLYNEEKDQLVLKVEQAGSPFEWGTMLVVRTAMMEIEV